MRIVLLVCLFYIVMPIEDIHAAQLPLLFCNSCTEAAKHNAAIDSGNLGDIYIADLDVGTVEAWYVDRELGGTKNPPLSYKTAHIEVTDEPYYSTALDLVRFYRTAPAGWRKHYSLSVDGRLSGTNAEYSGAPYRDRTQNVYNVINRGPAQNYLTDWVGDVYRSYMAGAGSRLAYLASEFHVDDPASVVAVGIAVGFDDGSHVDVNVDYSTTITKYRAEQTSVRDSHNNNVPATRQAATCGIEGGVCTYSFRASGNPEDYKSWRNQMMLLHVALLGDGVGRSPASQWVCTSHAREKVVDACTFEP